MALDDDVGRPVEAALAAAAARGVTVRVLVDSLHGLHGSFGLHNPLLDRLSARPGVELRVGSPITGESSLEDLKQRDHRKLVVVDGRVALLGGRNLSHEYYTGFDEVPLHPAMPWRRCRGWTPARVSKVRPWRRSNDRSSRPGPRPEARAFEIARLSAGRHGRRTGDRPPRPARRAHARSVPRADRQPRGRTSTSSTASRCCSRSSTRCCGRLQRGVRVRTLVGNLTPRTAASRSKGPGRRRAPWRPRSCIRGWIRSSPPAASATSSPCRSSPAGTRRSATSVRTSTPRR